MNTPTISPTINLNGTSGSELSEQCHNAWNAMREAVSALRAMTPHGRDYQTAPKGTYELARIQHEKRMALLDTVKGEIAEIYEAVEKQQRR